MLNFLDSALPLGEFAHRKHYLSLNGKEGNH